MAPIPSDCQRAPAGTCSVGKPSPSVAEYALQVRHAAGGLDLVWELMNIDTGTLAAKYRYEELKIFKQQWESAARTVLYIGDIRHWQGESPTMCWLQRSRLLIAGSSYVGRVNLGNDKSGHLT